jgi:hypothetical protein
VYISVKYIKKNKAILVTGHVSCEVGTPTYKSKVIRVTGLEAVGW